MAGRRLSPGEQARWARVMATVRPIEPTRTPPSSLPATPAPAPTAAPVRKAAKGRVPPPAPVKSVAAAPPTLGSELDGGWDRRLRRGDVMPDSTIDLHGHNLASAHALLDRGIDRALARGDRVLLLITGRPPGRDADRPYRRGAIRAAVHDWLAASRHADRIAAVRQAHPRHGGAGALYLIFRRPRITAPKS